MLTRNHPDCAIADYTEAIRLDPNYAPAYEGRGVAYLCKCEYDRAISDYSEVTRIKPNYVSAYTGRARRIVARANLTVRLPMPPKPFDYLPAALIAIAILARLASRQRRM